MRRLALPLLCLAALLAALLAQPGAAPAFTVGISDQQASTFTNPLYAPLKLKVARYIAPYDVTSDPPQQARLDAWLAAAQGARQKVLVAFEHSYKRSRQTKAPSVAAYTKAVKAFHRRYPAVKEVQAWNEANRCQRVLPDGNVVGQPICHDPRRAAQYYMAARKVFGRHVSGLDVLDQNNVKPSVAYVKKFLTYAHPRPAYWGFHNYSDTNRFSTKRTKALLKATGSGEVWLTETGGIVQFGTAFPYDEQRAARALGCMFSLARADRRITRLYIYQFNGATPDFSFDAGLVNPNGTPRPGWAVVQKRTSSPCRR
jgi:hypothetical protein